jgi:cellulose synthase/poly-beta-1,6-N-acetylglucosamine synthase-like glycosyltransferase
MSQLIVTIQIVLLVLAGLPLLYIFLLSILALFARSKQAARETSTLRRFAVVVPAHNEETAITRTLESLHTLEYPRNRFEIIVIADNCTDATGAIASQAGATVFERTNPANRGKGHALRWCFDKLIADSSPPDAIVVIDADSTASTNFLTVMNSYIERGARALQSSDLVAPQPGVWSAEATRLGFALYNYVRPLGRRMIGGHVGARGNGMCFTVEALREVPWNAFTQSEDLEYGLELLLHGIPVEFAPEAVVLAAMPSSSRNAESQRSRWEAGRLPILKRYAGKLIMAALRRRSIRLFDAFMDLVTPSLVNLLGVAITMGMASLLLFATDVSGSIFATVWFSLAAAGILHMLVGVLVMRDASLMQTVLYIPRYALWKMVLYAKLVRKGHTKEWVRTTRETTP